MENKIIITNENEKEYWIEYKKTLSPQIKEAFVVKYNNLATLSILKIIFSIAYACHKLYNFYYNYIYNIFSEFKYSDKKRNAFKINKIKYAKNLFSSKKIKAGVNNNDDRAK